ncbi:MAG: tRNA glutamyl-Q(34) synthetase GluQRS [Bacteroidales bacterium]|nr:tRNA glutamyl-Q(34) synthetase GluQRS [Bacteroidales bacterium]
MPENRITTGRFAPSPTGRMHLGNVYSAVLSWLSARKSSGRWVLRIEDLDPQRSKIEYSRLIEDDLRWLGLDWDEGGLADLGPSGPYSQSRRADIYNEWYVRLETLGLTYRCRCRRSDILASQAPHQSDGRVVYAGTCRPSAAPPFPRPTSDAGSLRLYVPDRDVVYTDRVFGEQCVNLARDCGDFILRRTDGVWAYQLAVVVDDACMGVTEVVRGADLLLSAAQQIYLYGLFGLTPPEHAHLPLLCNSSGQRLSKRDGAMAMDALRSTLSPEEVLGRVAFLAGVIPHDEAISLVELLHEFSWDKIVDKTKSTPA